MQEDFEIETILEIKRQFCNIGLIPDEISTGDYNYVFFTNLANYNSDSNWKNPAIRKICINFTNEYWENRYSKCIWVSYTGEMYRNIENKFFNISDPNCFDEALKYTISILKNWNRFKHCLSSYES